MKILTTTILFTLIGVSVFAQKQKLPPKDTFYPISKQVCEYPRQTGKWEIIRNDSTQFTTYRTENSEMIMYADYFMGFLTEWDNKAEAEEIYKRLDSLVSLLFQNGLLTSDLIIQANNVESKYIDHKGDTVDFSRHTDTKVVKLLNIEMKDLSKLPKRYKNKTYSLLFEIWVTFDPYESGWGSFPMFDLFLQGDIPLTKQNLLEYLKTAKIKCLRYTGTQI